jgi:hypothetical protein
MVKDLEDIVGSFNLTRQDINWNDLDSTNCTYPISDNINNAWVIDFKNITNPADLIVTGFDSICATCNRHYSVVFRYGTDYTIEQSGYNDIFLSLGVQNDYSSIEDFVEWLFNIIKDQPLFINHFTQYYYSGTKLYVYDYRGTSYTDLMTFSTNVYKVITGITASYNGDIVVGNFINKDNLHVFITYSTYEYEEVPIDDCILSEELITIIGDNPIQITYNNNTTEVVITGIGDLLNISAIYTGDKVATDKNGNGYIDKNLIEVTLDTYSKGSFILTKDEFEINTNKITLKDNTITITYSTPYESISCELTIETVIGFSRLMVWYEDIDVKVGEAYIPNHVIIYGIDFIGNWHRISADVPYIQFNDNIVLQEGENWFTCYYERYGQSLQDIFNVFGFIEVSVIDKDLQIMYIRSKSKTYNVNVTGQFLKYFGTEDYYVISEKGFLRACNKLELTGIFKVTAPKNTGLNCRFSSEWYFIVPDFNTIRATQVEEFRG